MMAKISILGAVTLLLMFQELPGIECASESPLESLGLDPISQTRDELRRRLPGFIQEKINRDNQTTRFINLENALQNLNRCNKSNRHEVSNLIKTVLIKEIELLAFELYDLVRATYLIIVAVLAAVQLDLYTPRCATTGGQRG